jgi:hypothetical protein
MMERRIWAVILTSLASGWTAVAAQTAFIDNQANWAAQVDLQKFKTTETGKFLLAQFEREPHRQNLDALAAVLQFDPRRQLHSLTAFGQGRTDEDGVVVFRGEFTPDHLITLVQANDAYRSLAHRGFTIHSWIDDKDRQAVEGTDRSPKRSYGAFHSKNLLLIGKDQDALATALDLYSGERPGLEIGQWLGPAWELPDGAYAYAGVRLGEVAHIHPHAALLKQAKAVQVHLRETAGQAQGRIRFEAEEPLLAEALKKIAEGMITLWQLKEGKDPLETELAQGVKVEQLGHFVTVSWGLPIETVRQAVEKTLREKGF